MIATGLMTGVLLAAAVAAPGVEGRWDVEIERAGWQPRIAKGRLALERDGKTWNGTIAFQVLMNGQRLTLEDVEVKGKKVSFLQSFHHFGAPWDVYLGIVFKNEGVYAPRTRPTTPLAILSIASAPLRAVVGPPGVVSCACVSSRPAQGPCVLGRGPVGQRP